MSSDGFSANTEGEQVSSIQVRTKPAASKVLLYGRSSVTAPLSKRCSLAMRRRTILYPRSKPCSLVVRGGHGGPPVQEYRTCLSAFSMIVTSYIIIILSASHPFKLFPYNSIGYWTNGRRAVAST